MAQSGIKMCVLLSQQVSTGMPEVLYNCVHYEHSQMCDANLPVIAVSHRTISKW